MFTGIVTTANRFEEDEYQGGLLRAKKGDLKTWQTVVSVGDAVRGVNVGDKVEINIMNYAVRKYDKNSLQNDMDNNKIVRFEFNWVELYDENDNPHEHLLLTDRDILYVFEGEDVKGSRIQMPPEKKLIVN
jgi:hypothetical protein